MNKKCLKIVGLLLVIIAFFSPEVQGDFQQTFYFGNLTNNSTLSDDISLSQQLSVVVSAPSLEATQVSFTFYNNVGITSSITDIYFDDGTLLGISSVLESEGASFTQNSIAEVKPPNLPAGNLAIPSFDATAAFSVDSDSPVMSNGVNASTEWVKIIFNLINDKTYSDTIAAIVNGVNDPVGTAGTNLRIGLHVQSINNGESDSFILVPIPATLLLGLLGLGIGGWKLRKSI